MLTQTEMQRILDQVNSRFDYLDNRINQLEEQLKKQPKPTTSRANKQVEEKA